MWEGCAQRRDPLSPSQIESDPQNGEASGKATPAQQEAAGAAFSRYLEEPAERFIFPEVPCFPTRPNQM